MTEHRGSRMHVLDWVDDSNFANEFLALAQPVACGRDQSWQHMPKSSADDRETRLESFGPRTFPEHASVFEELKSWWLAHSGNTPNWDIAARANIEGAPGLILVEAKANHPELDNGPKMPFRLSPAQEQRMTPEQTEASRARSQENEGSIAAALDEATRALAGEFEGIRLAHTSDYQLSNRIAFAWKVASLGDAGSPHLSRLHWRRCFRRSAVPERSGLEDGIHETLWNDRLNQLSGASDRDQWRADVDPGTSEAE